MRVLKIESKADLELFEKFSNIAAQRLRGYAEGVESTKLLMAELLSERKETNEPQRPNAQQPADDAPAAHDAGSTDHAASGSASPDSADGNPLAGCPGNPEPDAAVGSGHTPKPNGQRSQWTSNGWS
jgi:hypothetical protein